MVLQEEGRFTAEVAENTERNGRKMDKSLCLLGG